jgi:hypothetical protein
MPLLGDTPVFGSCQSTVRSDLVSGGLGRATGGGKADADLLDGRAAVATLAEEPWFPAGGENALQTPEHIR